VSCGVGRRRRVSDPTLLWLWCRLEATAPIVPLAWEPPYARSAALKRLKKKKKRLILLVSAYEGLFESWYFTTGTNLSVLPPGFLLF